MKKETHNTRYYGAKITVQKLQFRLQIVRKHCKKLLENNGILFVAFLDASIISW